MAAKLATPFAATSKVESKIPPEELAKRTITVKDATEALTDRPEGKATGRNKNATPDGHVTLNTRTDPDSGTISSRR